MSMTFEQYIDYIEHFNDVLKNYPKTPKAFKMHFLLVFNEIKDLEVLKSCFMKHLKTSDWFPSHIDLIKHTISPLPPIDAKKIIEESDIYHKQVKKILCEKYGLTLPNILGPEYKNRRDKDVASWTKTVQYLLIKLNEDFLAMKINKNEIITPEVSAYLEDLGE